MGEIKSFGGRPTGDTNNTNTSLFGAHFAADSIAHACLMKKFNEIKINQFSLNDHQYLGVNVTVPFLAHAESIKKIFFSVFGCNSNISFNNSNEMFDFFGL